MSIRQTPTASNARTQEHLGHKDTVTATRKPTTGAAECVSCFPSCNWTLPRFSNLLDQADTFKNDKDDFIISVPDSATVVATLIQMHSDGTADTETVISDNTYGLYYNTGGVKADVWAFILDWYKVADVEGFGKFKLNITITNSAATEIFNEDSPCYQLQNWTCQMAHRTFKIQTEQSGYFEGGFDYTGLDYLLPLANGKAKQATTWPQEVRLWGIFYRDGFPQERDNIVTEERGAQLIQSKIWKRYKLEVENISGSSNQDLVLTSATITALTGAGLVDGDIQSSIVIKVTTVPEYVLYKYGINPNSSTSPNYQSPLDNGEQAYQFQGITNPSTTDDLVWVGKEIGSSLGDVTIQFNSTRETYKHQFTIVHEFLIPFYTEGQLSNMQNQTNPVDLLRSNSLKYGNGFWFGGTRNETTMVFEDLGKIGNVGYFGDNFNGFAGDYNVTAYAVSNASNTGKLEATEANTITFTIQSDTATFAGGEEIILYHSKLPSSEDYGNSKTAYDTNWITSQVRQTEGAGAVASGVFTAVTVTFDAINLELDVSAVVTYTAAQQALLDNDTAASIYFTLATTDLADPDIMDRVNVVATAGQTSKDTQVTGLVTNWQPYIYKNAEFDGGVQYTDFDGWDGDLNGQDWTFRTDVTQGALISKMIFRVVADNGTSYFPLYQQSIPLPFISGVIVGSDQFQILDIDTQGVLNLPTDLLINQIKVNAVVPASSLGYQTWTGSIGFRVPWREWILNTAVPPTFVDYAEENNNLNTKSSNYSGVDSYTIKTVLSIVVQNDTGVDTEYDLLSDASLIADFDVTGTTFTASTKYYDSNNDLVTNLFTNDDTRVEVEFAHTTGTISLANITGRVWIEPANNLGEPIGELSTDLDFTSGTNALKPTDTLVTGNVTLVEVVSVNNLVTFIYEVDRNQITDGVTYNVYARIDSI